MARRLMLLADSDHESPWSRATGRESAVNVEGLGEGDQVWIKVDLKPEGELLLVLAKGLTPLLPFNPSEWARYKVGKKVNGSQIMTSVEVHFGND